MFTKDELKCFYAELYANMCAPRDDSTLESTYCDANRVWKYYSEKTDKEEYIRDNGEIINDFSYGKYGPVSIFDFKDLFPSFESYQWFRINVVRYAKGLIERVKMGDEWELLNDYSPETITCFFEYPNGKKGDVDMFISDTYGEVRKIDVTKYEARIPSTLKEQLALLSYDGYAAVHASSLLIKEPQDNLFKYLRLYNLYHKLRGLYDDGIFWVARFSNDCLLNEALCLAGDYTKRLGRKRNDVYSKLMETGVASPRWVSEYKLYTIIKSIYPDAIYQFRADWLGRQSLDVYVPSASLGIEYQGIQHYQSVDLFGGDAGLAERNVLDQKKRTLCKANNVTLIEFRFDEPIEQDYIKKKIGMINACTTTNLEQNTLYPDETHELIQTSQNNDSTLVAHGRQDDVCLSTLPEVDCENDGYDEVRADNVELGGKALFVPVEIHSLESESDKFESPETREEPIKAIDGEKTKQRYGFDNSFQETPLYSAEAENPIIIEAVNTDNSDTGERTNKSAAQQLTAQKKSFVMKLLTLFTKKRRNNS